MDPTLLQRIAATVDRIDETLHRESPGGKPPLIERVGTLELLDRQRSNREKSEIESRRHWKRVVGTTWVGLAATAAWGWLTRGH